SLNFEKARRHAAHEMAQAHRAAGKRRLTTADANAPQQGANSPGAKTGCRPRARNPRPAASYEVDQLRVPATGGEDPASAVGRYFACSRHVPTRRAGGQHGRRTTSQRAQFTSAPRSSSTAGTGTSSLAMAADAHDSPAPG